MEYFRRFALTPALSQWEREEWVGGPLQLYHAVCARGVSATCGTVVPIVWMAGGCWERDLRAAGFCHELS